MPPLRIVGVLGGLLACGLTNPIARDRDGAESPARIRVGIASASFLGDCEQSNECTVQLSVGKVARGWVRAEVVAVRLFSGETALGPVPVTSVAHWHHGAYREWHRVIGPAAHTKLSIDLGPVHWDEVLARTGRSRRPGDHDVWVEVDLAFDGEPAVVRSMFAVRPQAHRAFMVT